jgi:hypothetical protein
MTTEKAIPADAAAPSQVSAIVHLITWSAIKRQLSR